MRHYRQLDLATGTAAAVGAKASGVVRLKDDSCVSLNLS
jgi:hypothetical protein